MQDSRLVIERYKSGFSPPEDVPFEDLSNTRSGSIGSDSSSNGGVGSSTIHSTISLTSSGILKSETKGGTLTAMKLKKRAGIFSIFNAGKVKFQTRVISFSNKRVVIILLSFNCSTYIK